MSAALPALYVDTSVLAAYYCPEAISEQAEELLRTHPRRAVSVLVEVELFSAVARKVRMGELNAADARRILGLFVSHLDQGLYARLSPKPEHWVLARAWIGRLDLPLRTLDALHLALAHCHGLRLVTADAALLRCAVALGAEALWVTSGARET